MSVARSSFWLLVLVFLGVATQTQQALAAAPAVLLQTGKTAHVRLLTSARLQPGQQASEGMGFLFLVTPATSVNTDFAINETRDFNLNGESYQKKTQTELGRVFEPNTQVLGAEKFFAENPQLKPAEIGEIPKGTFVISIAMRGARIPPAAVASITLGVGYQRRVEDFTFSFEASPAQ